MRFCVLAAAASVLLAHDPVTTKLTWSGEISRIVYNRCAGCHREGGKAPMSLMTYEEARPWAKGIRDEVLARRMPPWGAIKGYGEFHGDLSLTQDEINRIAQWVEGAAPEGDPRYLPPQPAAGAVPASVPPKGERLKNPSKLRQTVQVLGVRPSADAATGKIYAEHPDGTIEPLLWLLNYKAAWKRTYRYKQPVLLPAGSLIHADVPFELVVKSLKPGH